MLRIYILGIVFCVIGLVFAIDVVDRFIGEDRIEEIVDKISPEDRVKSSWKLGLMALCPIVHWAVGAMCFWIALDTDKVDELIRAALDKFYE